jgi:hypothetical protein
MLHLLVRTVLRFAVFGALACATVDAAAPAGATAAAEQSKLPAAALQPAAECTFGTFSLYRTYSHACSPEQIKLLEGRFSAGLDSAFLHHYRAATDYSHHALSARCSLCRRYHSHCSHVWD